MMVIGQNDITVKVEILLCVFDETAVVCRIALQHFRLVTCKAWHIRRFRKDNHYPANRQRIFVSS